jgi:hypothetical protein
MSEGTFENLVSYTGNRYANNTTVQGFCDQLDDLKCADAAWIGIAFSSARAEQVEAADIVSGNRLHEPSSVSQRDFHLVEGVIMDELPNTEFVELSPLQPFGINTVLADLNEKSVVAALRRSEANADATSALFRLALGRFNPSDPQIIHLGSHARVIRTQDFKGTKFLPHFKFFGQTTVGKETQPHGQYGGDQLKALARHLRDEVHIVDTLAAHPQFAVRNTDIAVGHVGLMQELLSQGRVPEDIRKQTLKSDYNVLEVAGLDMPSTIPFDEHAAETLKDLGFTTSVGAIRDFQDILHAKNPELMPRLTLDISRIAGIGYYQHMCYKIHAENDSGAVLPLADGGTTSWAQRCSPNNKRVYTIASGLGTELIAQHFLQKT